VTAALALELIAGALIAAGAFFFFAGTVGLLRFPDVYCRLHALTKADNLGLGLISSGLILLATDWGARFQILLIWLLVLISSATICHLLARSSLDGGVPAAPGRRGSRGAGPGRDPEDPATGRTPRSESRLDHAPDPGS